MLSIKTYISNLSKYLSEPIDGRVLGLFRILFASIMVLEMIYYMRIDLVKNMYVLPLVNFKYDGLTWLTRLPEMWMDALIWVLLILAVLMALGVWFRWAARFFAIGYAYIFFLDKSIYNNHIYLYILFALMLSFTHADRFLSVSNRSARIGKIPRWEQWVFQAQMVIVYFYAGIVKIKYDWFFRQEPIRSLAKGLSGDHFFAPFLKSEVGIYAFTYAGIALDLASPILLWYKPVRRWGIYPFVLFHLTNSQIFDDIAFFPLTMTLGLLIFFEAAEIPWLMKWLPQSDASQHKGEQYHPMPTGWVLFLGFQMLFPFRGFFLPNDLDWTLIGQRFSWRVKMDSRGTTDLRYWVHYRNGQVAAVDITSFVNTHQIRQLTYDPKSVKDLAIAIKDEVTRQGGDVAAVKANISVTRNGRVPQQFIRPDVDLTSASYSPFIRLNWVVPFKE